MAKRVKIVEVGARDGLQNEEVVLSVAQRFRLVKRLSQAGLKNIEVGAFVSPKWVPQMASSDKLCKKVFRAQAEGLLNARNNYPSLVPNLIGMERAIECGVREVAVFASVSEAFSHKNINCSIQESLKRFAGVIQLARRHRVKVRGYLSMAFGCPYEGKISANKVARLSQALLDLGVYEVSIGDTIGIATPVQVHRVLDALERDIPLGHIAMHMHDTRGTALANVYASYERGVRIFDSSVGGLGGCPYANGAAGNLATEDLVFMLEGMGVSTGVDLSELVNIKRWMEKLVLRDLPSHVGKSGLPKLKILNSRI